MYFFIKEGWETAIWKGFALLYLVHARPFNIEEYAPRTEKLPQQFNL
jgi:hypothetical protein